MATTNFKSVLLDTLFPTLALMSAALIIWQHFGMNLYLEQHALSNPSAFTINDDINGGASIATLAEANNSLTLHCKTVHTHTFPFCSLLIPIANSKVIDLSSYSELELDIAFKSDQPDTVLIYILSATTDNLPITHQNTKAHLKAINPIYGRATYSLNLADFHIPSWWLLHKGEGLPVSTDLTRAVYLQISTGDNDALKESEITFYGFRMKGKWINAKDLYLGLLITWIVSFLLHFSLRFKLIRQKYLSSRQQARALNYINQRLSQERDRLHHISTRDPLTGCLNRAGFQPNIDKLIERFITQQATACLIIFDIDHFKRINDSFGHNEGDKVLVNLSQLVTSKIRNSDFICRWGGEEFVIACPNTPLSGGKQLAENLRQAIAEASLSSMTNITCSFGVAEVTDPGSEEWLRSADAALYKAKQGGRNQVVSA